MANLFAIIPQVDCDDERANDAILKGLKKRFEMTDKAPILIHTVSLRMAFVCHLYSSHSRTSSDSLARVCTHGLQENQLFDHI